MSKPLCIWHGNCLDGWTSAWVVHKYFKGEVDFFTGIYEEPPPDVEGRDVLIVDFSYPKHILAMMGQLAKSIIVLDHHKSAEEDLKDFPWTSGFGNKFPDSGVYCLFDMNRSGAGITWDYLFHNKHRPKIVNYVEDRDLWKFTIPLCKEINAALFSYPKTIADWDSLSSRIQDNEERQELVAEGAAIMRKNAIDITQMLGLCTRELYIGGHVVPVANMPYVWSSEAVNIMALGHPFAAAYYDGKTARHWSLRSSKDGMDVSEIAKKYGGGGHKHAAGFRTLIGWEGDLPT